MSYFGIDNISSRGVKQDFRLRNDIKTKKVETESLIVSGSKDNVLAAVTANTTTTLSVNDSGTSYQLTQPGAGLTHTIALPAGQHGLKYTFYLAGAGAGDIDITTLGGATSGWLTVATPGVAYAAVAGAATVQFVGGTSVAGDQVEITAIDENTYKIVAVHTAAGGITLT